MLEAEPEDAIEADAEVELTGELNAESDAEPVELPPDELEDDKLWLLPVSDDDEGADELEANLDDKMEELPGAPELDEPLDIEAWDEAVLRDEPELEDAD